MTIVVPRDIGYQKIIYSWKSIEGLYTQNDISFKYALPRLFYVF